MIKSFFVLLVLVIQVFQVSGFPSKANFTGINKEAYKLISIQGEDAYFNDVSRLLDENIFRIEKDLGIKDIKTVNIFFYPDLISFQNAAGIKFDPAAVGSTMDPFTVYMISPLYKYKGYDYDSILKIIIHEMTHCYCLQVNKNFNLRWASEGIACYEANQVPGLNDMKKINIKTIPSLFEFNFSESHKNDIYFFGYDLIDFSIKKWGVDSIRKLVLNNGDVTKSFGVTTDSFDVDFKLYMENKYK